MQVYHNNAQMRRKRMLRKIAMKKSKLKKAKRWKEWRMKRTGKKFEIQISLNMKEVRGMTAKLLSMMMMLKLMH